MYNFTEIKTGIIKIFSTSKATAYSAVLFALALTMLIVSCPLKKFLQSDHIAGSSLPVRTNQTNINLQNEDDINSVANSCYAAKNKIVLTKSYASQRVKLLAGNELSYISIQAGFGLNYFLNSTQPLSGVTVSTHRSDLPLFLQHLRLLI